MLRVFITFACLSLFACPEMPAVDGGTGGGSGSTGGGSGSTGGGAAPTVETWCETQTASNCTAGVACNVFESVTSCESLYARSAELGSTCSAQQAAVKDGRASFNASAAQSCLAAAATCGQANSCANAFTGLVSLDGGCYGSEECDGTLFCELGARCPGHCRARKPEGSRTSSTRECEAGLYAVLTTFDGGGFGYTCVRQAAPGESCNGYQSCLDPLICEPRTNTCVPLLAEDVACGTSDGGVMTYPVCAPPFACQPGFDGGQPSCRRLATRGEPCGQCQLDLRCTTPAGAAYGTCEPLGAAGAACSFDRDCLHPLYCKATGNVPIGPGVCTARGQAGAKCTSDFACERGLACVARAPRDGGIIAENVCTAVDGGVNVGCRDTTP